MVSVCLCVVGSGWWIFIVVISLCSSGDIFIMWYCVSVLVIMDGLVYSVCRKVVLIIYILCLMLGGIQIVCEGGIIQVVLLVCMCSILLWLYVICVYGCVWCGNCVLVFICCV